ncbi:hypothetical protein LPJ66_012037, partial [Kickxella alabastrina]
KRIKAERIAWSKKGFGDADNGNNDDNNNDSNSNSNDGELANCVPHSKKTPPP